MKKVLIVVTSAEPKKRRIYTGSVEWVDGWGLDEKQWVAVKSDSRAGANYVSGLGVLEGELFAEDTIIWVKGIKELSFPAEKFTQMIKHLVKSYAVFLVYHDSFVEDIIYPIRDQLQDYRVYHLSNNENQFKGILKTKGDKRQLDHTESFDKIFEAFLVNPVNVPSFLAHKLTNSLMALDTDLQALKEKGFSEDHWSQMIGDSTIRELPRKVKQCQQLIYREDIGLKRIYESHGSKSESDEERAALEKLWDKLQRLLPDPDITGEAPADPSYNKSIEIINAVAAGQKGTVQELLKDNNVFHEWFQDLSRTINELSVILAREHSDTVSV